MTVISRFLPLRPLSPPRDDETKENVAPSSITLIYTQLARPDSHFCVPLIAFCILASNYEFASTVRRVKISSFFLERVLVADLVELCSSILSNQFIYVSKYLSQLCARSMAIRFYNSTRDPPQLIFIVYSCVALYL